MKKYLISILFVFVGGFMAFSQNETNDTSNFCAKDTTLIKIEKIDEYIINKPFQKAGHRIIVYVISGRYADSNHKDYNEVLRIVSLDTLVLQKDSKPFVKVNGRSYNSLIEVNKTYLFHLELSGCFPIVLGAWYPFDYYVFDNVKIPTAICPLQPYKALELNGLNYDSERKIE